MRTRAAIYARVSSAKQKDAQTIASQLSTLPDYCKRQGWDVVATFIDDGKSAKDGAELLAARDGLRQLHAAAARGELDVVAVVDVDRFTRSEYLDERGAVYGPLQRHGVKIAVASTGSLIEWGTDTGDLLLGVGNMQSAGWLRKHRERIVRGKEETIRRGGKPAGPTPYGYHYDRATKTWSIDPEQSAIVREIFARLAGDDTCQGIAADLQARGVGRPRSGAWTRARVWSIAKQRHLVDGQWVADKRRKLTVTVPTFISEEEWRRTDQALRLRGTGRGRQRHGEERLLQGLMTCGVCGAGVGLHYTGRPSVGEEKKVWYYCSSRRRAHSDPHLGQPCSLPMFRAEELDAAAWAEIERLASRPDLLERSIEARGERQQSVAAYRRDLVAAQRQIERFDKRDAQIMADYVSGVVAESAYRELLATTKKRRTLLERQVAAARAQVEAADRDQEQTRVARDLLAALRHRMKRATQAERRAIVAALLTAGGERGAILEADGTLRGSLLLAAAVAPRTTVGYSDEQASNCAIPLTVAATAKHR